MHRRSTLETVPGGGRHYVLYDEGGGMVSWMKAPCRAGVLLICWLLAGCGGGEEGPSTPPVPGTPMEIETQPRLSLGVASGDTVQEFFGLRTPFILPGGKVAVPLEGTGEVRVFDGEGRFLETLGGSGEGPGEFVALTAAWARGDTIEALDGDLMRITRFVPGDPPEVVRLEATTVGVTAPRGSIPDVWLTVGWAGSTDSGRDLWALQLFGRDGTFVREVAQVEGMARISVPGYSGPHPLSPRAVLRTAQGRIYLAETLTPRIQVFGPTGTAEEEVTWTPMNSIRPRDALAAIRDSAMSSGVQDPIAAELLRTDEVPDRVSVFWDFMVDELGFIWVRPYDPVRHSFSLVRFLGGGYMVGTSAEGGQWRIFTPEGLEVGSVEVPEGLALAQITRDAVLGIRIDPVLGFESVQVHPLKRY